MGLLDELKGLDRDTTELVAFLERSSFFSEPASTRFHGNFPGGLAKHCVAMSERLKFFCLKLSGSFQVSDRFDPVVVAVCHDLDKIGKYSIDSRNVKRDGKWESIRFYKYKGDLRYYSGGEIAVGHAARLLSDLSPLEHLAIRWVEGMYAVDNNKDLLQALTAAVAVDPRIILSHTADMLSSRFDEETIDEYECSERIMRFEAGK